MYSYKLFSKVSQIDTQWDSLAGSTIFLSRKYLQVLENSSPTNMSCYFLGIYNNQELEAIFILQILDVQKLESFGDRDKCFRASVRKFFFQHFCSHVLFVGNNMLTGENFGAFKVQSNNNRVLQYLNSILGDIRNDLKKQGIRVHITTIKDFSEDFKSQINNTIFTDYYSFTIQPNMLFTISDTWKTENDYINALQKKYRDQYKRARKKSEGVLKKRFSLKDISQYNDTIYNLYHYVAQNAPFNTFFLAKNHFIELKEKLEDDFCFYGYFVEEKLVGFNTLIKNGNTMETYFLGYNEAFQKEKMLYLNMLYDMIGYSIHKHFKHIVFGRTALEIKSSVGAKPQTMYGFIKHQYKIMNWCLPYLFKRLEPEVLWKERNPFKE